jgi:hypothetical protein
MNTPPLFAGPFSCLSRLAALAALLLLCACASKPPIPDWQLNTQSAMDRSVNAYLAGNTRIEILEFDKARSEIARTGRPELMARAELLRCAGRVASLVFEGCSGFEKLRQDANPAERAYADYLGARVQPQDISLLPPQQRAAASASADAATVKGIADPLSRLVAAGVLFQTGQASPAIMALAVDTASTQGWRRPLLAWLQVQAQRAEQAGDLAESGRLRRRIALVQEAPGAGHKP